MKNTVSYEYTAEPTDEHGDIIDALFGDSLAEVKDQSEGFESHVTNFGLVRNEGNEINGLQERGYAYFDTLGRLPDYFDDGHKVPVKYIRKHNA